MGKRVVTAKDLAEAYGVHENTIRNWAASGQLPPRLPGYRLRWRWEDLKEMVGTEKVEK